MRFIGKAETLLLLKNFFPNNVPKLKIYNTDLFLENPNKIFKDIKINFKGRVAIRSTYKNEDSKKYSNAGKYSSSLNIEVKKKELLINKINKTIISYEKKKKSKFFIQKMVENVSLSGVCLTKSINSSIPSFEINFSKSNKTDIVTSGKSNIQNLIYLPNKKYQIRQKKFFKLIHIVHKLIKLFKSDLLDIEFAITKNNKVYILQVRPLVIKKKYLEKESAKVIYENISKKIFKLQKKHHSLLGKTTYFSVMPDWNPAEIIGVKPSPLALSLYQELITNNVWSKNRFKFGFQNVETSHLMTTIYGTPFVDVRVDFNSWIPDNLNYKTKEKLVNFYLDEFKNDKNSHDKVEFDILFTCYTPEIEKKLKKKLKKKFSIIEIKKIIYELKKITNNLIKNYNKEISLIKELEAKQKLLKNKKIYSIDKIYWLVEDCKKYGTNPFASLARCAFISIEFLNSFLEQKILTIEEKYDFLNSIRSVTSNIIKDFSNLNKKKFLKIYGHLRPNTYDINMPNYKDGYYKYFSTKVNNKIEEKKFFFNKAQKEKINLFLKKTQINLDYRSFIVFLRKSIEQREYAKFIFTKSIDIIFENIKILSKRLNIDKRDLSYLKINKILEFHYNLDNSNLKKVLEHDIKLNKKEFNFNKFIKLPEIITSPRDLYVNYEKENKTNFVTTKTVSSNLVFLNNLDKDIQGKIVVLENADPGYDFIFNKKIKGLITKFGGVNSHMAIRCAELSLPAAIGVGEIIYKTIQKKKYITLDCGSQKIS